MTNLERAKEWSANCAATYPGDGIALIVSSRAHLSDIDKLVAVAEAAVEWAEAVEALDAAVFEEGFGTLHARRQDACEALHHATARVQEQVAG